MDSRRERVTYRTWTRPRTGNAPTQISGDDDGNDPKNRASRAGPRVLVQNGCWKAPICEHQGVTANNQRWIGWEIKIAARKGWTGIAETHGRKGVAGGTHRRCRVESQMGAWCQTQRVLDDCQPNSEQGL